MKRVFIGLFMCFFSTAVLSNETDVVDASSVANGHIERNTQANLVEVGQWQFALSLGIGQKSNPLVNGDDYPLFIIPSARYYGEKLFFDNGDLGYTLIENQRFALSGITRLNEEVVHFVDWHPANTFVSAYAASSEGMVLSPSVETPKIAPMPDYSLPTTDMDELDEMRVKPEKIEYQALSKRKWSLDAGVQANWFVSERSSFKVRLLTDISQIHHGSNINLEFNSVNSILAHWQVKWGIGTDWLNQSLTQYYYGIDQRDNVAQQYYYQTGAAWLPYIRINPSYRINQHWRLVGLFKYQYLPTQITNSPVIKQKQRLTIFTGVSYAF